jgi:hypothetical protein
VYAMQQMAREYANTLVCPPCTSPDVHDLHWQQRLVGTRARDPAQPKRARRHELPAIYCDGKYRCWLCCPVGQSRRLGKPGASQRATCSNISDHQPHGISGEVVCHLVRHPCADIPDIHGLESVPMRFQARVLAALERGGCAKCRAQLGACHAHVRRLQAAERIQAYWRGRMAWREAGVK